MSKLVCCTACSHPVAFDAAICPRCGRQTPAPLLWQLVAFARNLVLGVAGAAAVLAASVALFALLNR